MATRQLQVSEPQEAESTDWKITLIGVTPEVHKAHNEDSLLIEILPYGAGRQASGADILSYNELVLQDEIPHYWNEISCF
ncbi:MAG: hypothetical protein MUP70_01695 [Candidatus Aminicenantes bacterium]|nr:hypothetical protein [Candidatus Aminicenantes bacterium]